MRTALSILIIIGVIAVSPFVIGFLWAAVSALIGRTQKRERAEALFLLSRLPSDVLTVLLRIFSAYTLTNVEEANRQVARHESQVRHLLDALTRPRQPGSSAGTFGDSLNLTVWTTELAGQGYSAEAAAIISAVHHHHLDGALAALLARENSDARRA